MTAYILHGMVPRGVETLFWDTNLADFDPLKHPDYTIFPVLEYGDRPAVRWMRAMFDEGEIRRIIRTEGRLSRKSATSGL